MSPRTIVDNANCPNQDKRETTRKCEASKQPRRPVQRALCTLSRTATAMERARRVPILQSVFMASLPFCPDRQNIGWDVLFSAVSSVHGVALPGLDEQETTLSHG